jgi:hypothetical protein
MILQASRTFFAGDMVDGEHPVSRCKFCNIRGNLNDFTCYLMAQDEGGPFDSIPLHHIAAADTAGFNLDKDVSLAELRLWHFLDSNIAVIVVHSDFHDFVAISSTLRDLLI